MWHATPQGRSSRCTVRGHILPRGDLDAEQQAVLSDDMDATPVTLCRSNADCVIGASSGVVVVFWRHHTHVEDVDELARAVRSAQRGSEEPVRLVQVVPQSATTPDGRVRAALARMLRGLTGVVSHSVVLYEGEGFRAAMIRSIATSVLSLSSPGFPHRVFGQLPEAAAWMSGGDTALSARHIEEVVERVRTAVGRANAADRRAKEREHALD
jgi:hypothetical protein